MLLLRLLRVSVEKLTAGSPSQAWLPGSNHWQLASTAWPTQDVFYQCVHILRCSEQHALSEVICASGV
jgi:hypothetical protein